MGLRLVAAAALATLWMLGTWVLRAPAALALRLTDLAPSLSRSPGALIAAPLAALRARRARGARSAALAVLALVALLAVALSAAIARRAGLAGWEEAGAVWAESAPGPRGHRFPTAATKDLLLIVRDRPQLLALVAMPILFVGVQIFGAAGWSWSTGSLSRVSCLAYSLALYMATIGPLTHMQAERRAFWILRTVPVPLGRLLAAKARAWAVLVGATAVLAFVPLSFAMPGIVRARAARRRSCGRGGRGGDELPRGRDGLERRRSVRRAERRRRTRGRSTRSCWSAVSTTSCSWGSGATRVAGLSLYLFVDLGLLAAGVERAELCMDAEALGARRVRVADGATLVVLYAVGARRDRGRRVGARRRPGLHGHGLGSAWWCRWASRPALLLLRRPRALPRWGLARALALALALGAAVGYALAGAWADAVAGRPQLSPWRRRGRWRCSPRSSSSVASCSAGLQRSWWRAVFADPAGLAAAAAASASHAVAMGTSASAGQAWR